MDWIHSFCNWSKKGYKGGDGILVGSDLSQEWLLPWWWEHYTQFNDFPVTWIDLGLSDAMHNWCKERGEVVKLRIPDIFVKTKEEVSKDRIHLWEGAFGTSFWEMRNAWFKKPMAYLHTPYLRTIWVDCDCEIRGNLKPLFDFCEPTGISLRDVKTKIFPVHYSSGVLVYRYGHLALELCAKEAWSRNDECFSDDQLLTEVLTKGNFPVQDLPDIWHRTRRESEEGALIFHWIGTNGKKIIRAKLTQKTLECVYEPPLS